MPGPITASAAKGALRPVLGGFLGIQTISSAVVYTNTAFISSTGDDGTAVLNNPGLPFATLNAVAAALVVAYPSDPTTIRALSNIAGDATGGDWDTLLHNGLTFRSHDGTKRTFSGSITLGNGNDSLITLVNVNVATLAKPALTNVGLQPAGTITGDSNSVVSLINVSASSSPAAPGTTGSTGASGTGTPDGPPQPAPNSPPDTGTAGGAFNGDALDDATGGAQGESAWGTITLLGTMTVTSVVGTGQPGGTGGAGGIGGTAVGGAGGQGGDSNAIILEDGGTGGAGGDASSNGGTGKQGGDGGNGTTVNKAAGVTITANTLTGGAAGGAGDAGAHGTATAGAGGLGGAGAIGGATGATGADGTATANDGSPGSSGSAGTDGSIVVI